MAVENDIDASVRIQGDVKLGRRNQILPGTILIGPLVIGDDNIIGPYAVIGSPGANTRDPRYDSSRSPIQIGSRNIIREFSSVQKACYSQVTSLGDDVFVMSGVHIQHDAKVSDKVVLSAGAVIGGSVFLLEGANVGMGATVHQHIVIGAYSIVATNAAAVKSVRPFCRHIPGQPPSLNDYAINRFGFGAERAEISDYVSGGARPVNDRILGYVEIFERLQAECRRGVYA